MSVKAGLSNVVTMPEESSPVPSRVETDGSTDNSSSARHITASSSASTANNTPGSPPSNIHPTTTASAPTPKTRKKLDVMQAIFGECLCADAITLFNTNGTSKLPNAQFVLLDGIECIALGAVVDEQKPVQRVMRTVDQLITNTARLIGVGYIKDGVQPSSASESANMANDALVDEDGQGQLLRYYEKITEVLPLNVWKRKHLEATSKPNRRGNMNAEFVFPLAIGSTIDYLKRNEFDLALEVLEDILQDQRETRGENSKYFEGLIIHNIGVVHMLKGNYSLASPAFKEAVRAKRVAFGGEHPEVAVSLVESGIQLFASEQFDEALVILNDALKIRVQAYGSSSPKVAMVLNNIGCVHFEMGNHLAALGTFQEAYEIQQLALGSSQKADLDLLHSATILSNIGYIKLQVKNYEEARIVLEEAMLVQQSVLGDDHRFIKDTISNMEFANAFHS